MSRTAQVVGAAGVVIVILVGAGLATSLSARILDVGDLTRDPTAIAGVPWWTGAVSRLTNLGWAVAATANILAGRVAAPSRRLPLLLLGLLCGALAIDDTMLVHEAILPRIGVPEDLLLAAYALAGLALAWSWFWSTWRAEVTAAFVAGAAALAVSVAVDLVSKELFLLEDGAKLIGVLAWCFCGVWAHSERA
ncbi:hypothetical protein BH20ACT6_BH20ACT6_07840 [soil metagenome]